MNALEKAWTWVGYLVVTSGAAIWIYISGGGFDPITHGAKISLSLWGGLLSSGGGVLLAWIGIAYCKLLNEGELFGWPKNTTFEDIERHALVSKLSLCTYVAMPFFVLVACISKYAESEIAEWSQNSPLSVGFISSRLEAYRQGCEGGACFRITPVDGHEFLLYFTDSALLVFILAYLVLSSIWMHRIFRFHKLKDKSG